MVSVSSVRLLSHFRLFVTPWTAAQQAPLSITNSQSLLKLMSIESVIPSNHLILCRPLLLPSIFPSIRVFSNGSVLCIRWPKYWSFSFNISPSNEYSGLISFRRKWCKYTQLKDKWCQIDFQRLNFISSVLSDYQDWTICCLVWNILKYLGNKVKVKIMEKDTHAWQDTLVKRKLEWLY